MGYRGFAWSVTPAIKSKSQESTHSQFFDVVNGFHHSNEETYCGVN